MLQELADESKNQGLKMNKSKTKVMIENDTPIYVNNTQVEKVESYTYLRQHQRPKPRQGDSKKNCDVETWALTTQAKNKLAATHNKWKGVC